MNSALAASISCLSVALSPYATVSLAGLVATRGEHEQGDISSQYGGEFVVFHWVLDLVFVKN